MPLEVVAETGERPVRTTGIGGLERFVGDNARPPRAVPPRFAASLGRVAIVGLDPDGFVPPEGFVPPVPRDSAAA